MTDARLRDLERRWKEIGTPEDRLAYVKERVRGGSPLSLDDYLVLSDLEPESAADYLRTKAVPDRLGLAAQCGHGLAALAMARPIEALDTECLAELPRVECMVLGAAAVRGAMSVWNSQSTDPALDRVLTLIGDSIRTGSPIEQQAVREVGLAVNRAKRAVPFSFATERAHARAQAASDVAQNMCSALWLPVPRAQTKTQHALHAAGRLLGKGELASLMLRESLAWALEVRQQLGIPPTPPVPGEPPEAERSDPGTPQGDLRQLLRALQLQGREPYVRALLGMGRMVMLPLLRQGYPNDEGGAALLDALEGHLRCPCQDHEAEIQAIAAGWEGVSSEGRSLANFAVLFIAHLACDLTPGGDGPPPPAKQGWQHSFECMEGIYRNEALTAAALQAVRDCR